MAVQKSKKSRARRDHRRAQTKKMATCVFSDDPMTGERHRRHHVTEKGYYRGKLVVKSANAADDE